MIDRTPERNTNIETEVKEEENRKRYQEREREREIDSIAPIELKWGACLHQRSLDGARYGSGSLLPLCGCTTGRQERQPQRKVKAASNDLINHPGAF